MSKSNLLKAIGALVVLVGVIALLVWGPFSSGEPDPGPDVRVPSMENVPAGGTHLTIEINPQEEGDKPKTEE